MANRLLELQIHHLQLPFRTPFHHAAATRQATDTIVVAALLADGTLGYGEGLPREYVTGESVESVLYHVAATFADQLTNCQPKRFPDLLDLVDNLPFTDPQGHLIHAARSAVELALLDAYSKHFNTPLHTIPGWLGYPHFGQPGSLPKIRVSAILDADHPEKLRRRYRLFRLFALKDFKLKLATPFDDQVLSEFCPLLDRQLLKGKISLRADANAACDIDAALNLADKLAHLGFCCLEQPLDPSDTSHLFTLADLSPLPLMADESLRTLDEAAFLAENDLVDDFNIRISKHGGLLPSLRIAQIAHRHNRQITLGAMVGESAILAAAGQAFLQAVPDVRFTEIAYSTFLLKKDLAKEKIRFRYQGRLRPLSPPGLGLHINPKLLQALQAQPPRNIPLA